jgi:hypothetical protein
MTEKLERFGYTEREAVFLGLAAFLSGYFLRRHFNAFIGKECGALAQRFISRSIRLGHIRAIPALGNRVFYHVCSHSLYAALGDPENRNRREHRPETIRRRLMALDFCLLNSGARCLLTEREKLDHFVTLGVDEEYLPVATPGSKAKRYFADKQPVCISADCGIQFAFVDEGLRTLSQWALFLKAHRELLRRVEKAEVVYGGCDSERFRAAENLFRRMIAGQTDSGTTDVSRLKRYFLSRKLFEEKRFESFNQSRLDELREDRRVFAGASVQDQYSRWLADGDPALTGLKSPVPEFRTQLLPYLYDWLSPIPIHERRAHNAPYCITAEKNSRGPNGQTRQVDS